MKNTFKESTFYFEQYGATVDGCHFVNNYSSSWYKADAKIKANDLEGRQLDTAEFTSMKLRDIKPETVTSTPAPTMTAKAVAPGTEVSVKTIDEFLSAIGPDRTIVLDGTNFDLTKAKNYAHYP